MTHVMLRGRRQKGVKLSNSPSRHPRSRCARDVPFASAGCLPAICRVLAGRHPANVHKGDFGPMTRANARKAVRHDNDLPPSTRWHRAHGRPSRRDKAIKQQLLTPPEEKALADYVLRMAQNDYPLPTKLLPSLATVILQRRTSASNGSNLCQKARRPGINWARAFLGRHPDLKGRNVVPDSFFDPTVT